MVPAWVGSSILPGGFKVQWHTLSRWFANVEIDLRLFVAFGMLLSPQDQGFTHTETRPKGSFLPLRVDRLAALEHLDEGLDLLLPPGFGLHVVDAEGQRE